MIVAAYEELIADILLRTARPTKALLQAAVNRGSRSKGQKLRCGPRESKSCQLLLGAEGFVG